ncbi:hypothetical protein [Bradyrhizobium japonicum]|uniref:hypothetical protein n=1 Tax=Bradyrhizobium japonicum TaxID=375 RepID=UPI00200F0BC8|nr:hypothetical protein [Bradyrhizobium japonicum]UQD96062.1 hypothetical protein JEY30_31465 [Bradyrhizobium japonicum]
MRELNEKIRYIELPPKMRRLPIDERGFPVPKFVPWVNGKPEFRGFDPDHMRTCVRLKRCWLCGDPLGVHMTSVIGTMCIINRIAPEPPSHHGCGLYAARACPFLATPGARRNEKDLPEHSSGGGHGIKRNPGVVALWTSKSYRVVKTATGPVFEVGEPEEVEFFCEGRKAKRDEIMLSIETGLPILQELATKQGPEAEAELAGMVKRAMKLVPAE